MNLEEENQQLKLENAHLKEQLKKYTNPQSFKTYYEKNKDKILEQQRAYKKEKYHNEKMKKTEEI
jgi:regulator of replication initiation timing